MNTFDNSRECAAHDAKRMSLRAFKAFTLIELLVVIAIIAILAAILFPVFGRARENARRTSCLSNMKQIGLSIAQYTQDYDERMPYGQRNLTGDPRSNNGVPCAYGMTGLFWPQLLEPYTSARIQVLGGAPWFAGNEIYLCPNLQGMEGGGCNGRSVSSYSANRTRNILPFEGIGGGTPINISQIQRPAEVLLLTEQTRINGAERYPEIYAPEPSPVANTPEGRFSRHFDGANNLFSDGHAKWLKETTIRSNRTDMFAEGGL